MDQTTSKAPLVIGIVIVAAIVIMVLWIAMQNQETAPTPVQTPQTSATPVTQEEISTDIIISKDSSDTAIDQDLAGIDKQANGLAQDSAAIDAGINTTPAPEQF